LYLFLSQSITNIKNQDNQQLTDALKLEVWQQKKLIIENKKLLEMCIQEIRTQTNQQEKLQKQIDSSKENQQKQIEFQKNEIIALKNEMALLKYDFNLFIQEISKSKISNNDDVTSILSQLKSSYNNSNSISSTDNSMNTNNNNNINNVKHQKWTLTMCSKQEGYANTFEALVDTSNFRIGASTEYTNTLENHWIQANFSQPVIVSAVKLAPLMASFLKI